MALVGLDERFGPVRDNPLDMEKEYAQAVINAAWTTFDPEDKETWPKSEYAPSGVLWLRIFIPNSIKIAISQATWGGSPSGWRLTAAYADPADLMPTRKGADDE